MPKFKTQFFELKQFMNCALSIVHYALCIEKIVHYALKNCALCIMNCALLFMMPNLEAVERVLPQDVETRANGCKWMKPSA